MRAGISTACFYPQYTEDTMKALMQHNVECVEIFFNCMYEVSPSFMKEMRRMADANGTKIVSLHPYTSGMEPMYFFSNYRRRYEEGRELYRHYYEAANIAGAELVVFHGAGRFQKDAYEEYFDRFGPLWQDAHNAGISLCQENVQRCISARPEFFTALARAVPGAEFVFDIKQAIRADQDVLSFAEMMGSRIRHIHISDHNRYEDCMIPGRGILNIPELLNTVRKNGFDGNIVVELYRENFDTIVDILAGYQQICTFISTADKIE